MNVWGWGWFWYDHSVKLALFGALGVISLSPSSPFLVLPNSLVGTSDDYVNSSVTIFG
jgi:hypothetical protein